MHWRRPCGTRRSSATHSVPARASRFCPAPVTWMASIMPASQKSRWHPDMRTPSLGMLLLGLALVFAARADAANFGVKNAKAVLVERTLLVNARFDLRISPRIEEALNKGIPIDVVIDANMVRHRWWWRNRVITDHTLRRRIQFHALSRQYLVNGLRAHEPSESFGSLTQALAPAGTLDGVHIFF